METLIHLDYIVTVAHNKISKKAQKGLLEAVASNIDADVIYESIEATMQAEQDPKLFPEVISLQEELEEWGVNINLDFATMEIIK